VRDIVECRAKQDGVDFVNRMATALMPLAFFEVVVMNKAFRRVVDDDAEVGVETGLRAAEKLQSVLDKRDQGDEIAEMRRQVNQILNAVKAVVPQEMWGARSSRSWTRSSSIRTRSMLRPRISTTMTPKTRSSSSMRMTSFDVGLDWRYRGRPQTYTRLSVLGQSGWRRSGRGR
jgi:hypothetical protein